MALLWREPGSSKGTDGRDKRRSAGRKGFFNCPRPGPHPWATPDPVLPERGCQVQAGRRGTAGTERTKGQEAPALCIAALASGRATFRGTCRPALDRLPRSNGVPPVLPRVAEAKSIKIRTLLTLPCWGGRSRSMLSPYIVGVECRLHLRGSFPVSPLPDEAPCPLLSYCGKPAGLWAPLVGAAVTVWEGIAARLTARLSRTRLGLRLARVGAWSSGSGSSRAGAPGARGAVSSPLRGVRASLVSGGPLAVPQWDRVSPVEFLGADRQVARALLKAT